MKPVAISSSLPREPARSPARAQPSSSQLTVKSTRLTREDLEEIARQNKELEESGLGDPEEGAFTLKRLQDLEESDGPPAKKSKMSTSAQMISKVFNTLGDLQQLEKVLQSWVTAKEEK